MCSERVAESHGTSRARALLFTFGIVRNRYHYARRMDNMGTEYHAHLGRRYRLYALRTHGFKAPLGMFCPWCGFRPGPVAIGLQNDAYGIAGPS
jgi:hypothetical protein